MRAYSLGAGSPVAVFNFSADDKRTASASRKLLVCVIWLGITVFTVIPENVAAAKITRMRQVKEQKITPKNSRAELRGQEPLPPGLKADLFKYSRCSSEHSAMSSDRSNTVGSLSGTNHQTDQNASHVSQPRVKASGKAVAISVAACYQGQLRIPLSQLKCTTADIYISLHCGQPCTLCEKQAPGSLSQSSPRYKKMFRSLEVPTRLQKCTNISIAPDGGYDTVMHMQLIHDIYHSMPPVMAFMKDTWRRTLIKANYGRLFKHQDRFADVLAKLQAPSIHHQIGFTGLYHRLGHSTARFTHQPSLKAAMDTLYEAIQCHPPPNVTISGKTVSKWNVIPGGLIALHRSRIHRMPREWYGHVAKLMTTYPPGLQLIMAISMEHNWGTIAGCAPLDSYPQCPLSNWIVDARSKVVADEHRMATQ